MFSSLTNNNGYHLFGPLNPFQTTTIAAPAVSFTTHFENPSFVHPSPFMPYSHEAFLEKGILGSSCNVHSSSTVSAIANNSVVSTRRRRTRKKDKHSKVYTAQGPRDRRMRLSPQVAREFFDLQAILGFDKASKTIEWLLSKSNASIEKLKESVAAYSGGGDEKQKNQTEMDGSLKGFAERRAKDFENSSSSTKKSRDKARERARERTMMKKMKMRSSSSSSGFKIHGTCFDHQETNSKDLDQLGSSGTSQESLEDLGSCSQETKTPIEIVAQDQEQELYMLKYHQVTSVSIFEKFLGVRSYSSSSSICGHSSNIGDSTGESYTDLSGNRNIRTIDGVDRQYFTGNRTVRGNLNGTSTTGNIFQVENPNASSVLVSLDLNPNLTFPLAIASSASTSINHPNNEETNPNSSVSIYENLH